MKRNKDLLIAFFGTPDFAVRVLERMAAHDLVPALILTAPDKPKGRGRVLTPSPAKVWGSEHGIDVMEPPSLKGLEGELRNSEWDLFVVAAYGKIIPAEVLAIPTYGTLNVHPSLLPKFRGPSPVPSSILADERETGVSIMLLDGEMDHGPIIAQARVEIEQQDWPLRASVLEPLLADEGGNLLAEAVAPWVQGDIKPQEQDHAQATFTRKCTDEDARLDFDPLTPPTGRQAYEALLKIRAFDTNPRAYMIIERNGKPIRVIIADAEIEDSTLRITRVIPEGKKEMPCEDFMRGMR